MDDTDSDENTPRPSGATNSDSHQTTSVSKSRLSGATNSDGHQTPSVSKSRLSGATNSDGHQTPSVSKYRLSGATNSDGHQTPSVSKSRLSGATNSDGHQTLSVSKSRLSGATNSDGHQTPSVSKSRPSFSKSRLSRDVKETIRIFESKSQGRTDVAEKSRRISEHVKDAKERFRLAVKTEGGRQPTQTSRNSSNKSTSNQSGQPPTKCDHAGQLKIFRGNLKTDNPRGQITLKDIPQLNLRADTDNEWPEEPIQRKTPTNSDNNNNNNNNNNSNNSLRLDLTTNTDNAGLPLRKPAAKNLLSERNKDKDYGNDVNDNTSPPLTPRCTPRTTSKRQDRFSYIPTPRRSEDKLPSLSLSAKEDIIKEIAPGLLLKPRDSEHTSSRSSLASSASSLRSSVTSVISLTELKTLRVSCKVSEDAIVSTATNNNSSNGVTSVITSNMSVTDMKRVLLGRSRVKGVEPANFCVIAVRTLKGKTQESPDPDVEDEMVQVETEILQDDAHPFEEGGRHLRRTK